MEINVPSVPRSRPPSRYEEALNSNDVATLDQLSGRARKKNTLRYGVASSSTATTRSPPSAPAAIRFVVNAIC